MIAQPEDITKRKKGFAKRFQELKNKPKKKEEKHKEYTMGSVSDGEGELKSKKRIGVMEKIKRFGSRDNLDDISKDEKEHKKLRIRGRRRKEEKEEDHQAKRKRSKSRDGALGFLDRFKGVADDSSGDEEEFAHEFLKAANRCRKNHGLESFVASKELNTLAHDWVRSLAKEQNIKERKAQKYGKNIYKKELKNEDEKVKAEDIIYSWYQEINNFKFGQNPLDPDITKNATQLLWKDSRVVGFGRAKSSSKNVVYVAAYFSPRGNIIGKFVENVPPLGGFSPRLSKSDKGRGSSDDEEKATIQETSLEKVKEGEKGKIKFFTHMFDKFRKNPEGGPDVAAKKDKNEPYGYIGNRQGKYIINQERSSVSSSQGNIFITSTKELEEAKHNLRSQAGESKTSLELDSILNRSKQFENAEKLQKSEAKEDEDSSSSSDEEQLHQALKRNDSFSNKQNLDIDKSSNSLHDHPKEIHSLDSDITLKTENKVENCNYNSDQNIKVDSSSVKRNSLKELQPRIDHDPQEIVVLKSKIKLINSDTITISNEHLEEKNKSDVTHKSNEEFKSKTKKSSGESSDSDESDSESKRNDSTKKPGIFNQMKTKAIRLVQNSPSNSEESSEDEDKFKNKNLDNTVNPVFVASKPVTFVTAEKSEVSSPVFQKENEPLYDMSFQFTHKEREDTEDYTYTNDAILSQRVKTNEILLEKSNPISRVSNSDSSSSSDEETETKISTPKPLKNEINGSCDEEITLSNEYNYVCHKVLEHETKLDTFEPLPEKQKPLIERFQTEIFKDDSSSEEEEKEVITIVTEKKLVRLDSESDRESENTNRFQAEMQKDLKLLNLSPNESNALHSDNAHFHDDSHNSSSDEKHHNVKTIEEIRLSEPLENSEIKRQDSRERLRSFSSSDNEEKRKSVSNDYVQKLFFDAVKVEVTRKHDNKDLSYDVNNTVMTQMYNESEVDVNNIVKVAESTGLEEVAKKIVLNEEKLSSSNSDASDNENNHQKHKKYTKSPKTVHKILDNKPHEDTNDKECFEVDRDFENNNFLIDSVHEGKQEINTAEAHQSEANVVSDSHRSEVKPSTENQQSSSESDTGKKSRKPPIRRKSLKNLLQGISGKKRNETPETDVSQNKTIDSPDTTSGNDSSSSKSSIKQTSSENGKMKVHNNSQLEIHLNSSDSESHEGKRKVRRKSLKNLLQDLSLTKKHDKAVSNSDGNGEISNAHTNANVSTSPTSPSRNSISSKNSETESSDMDSSDHKHKGSLKKRRKSLKDIFHDLKLTITHDNTDSERSGTVSPATTTSPTCDKGQNNTAEKHKNESYISRIKHIFESSENILHKCDNSEKYPANVLHENENFNKEEYYNQVLEEINKIRKKHNSDPLTISKQLCDIAVERAENLASGIAGHLQNDIGENIFIHTVSGAPIKEVLELAVRNWYKTISYHRFGVEEHNMKAGSFTQLVWRSSVNLGVGIYKSQEEVPHRIIIMALFSPAGNIKGKFRDEVNQRSLSSESEFGAESSSNEFDSQNKMVCSESKQI